MNRKGQTTLFRLRTGHNRLKAHLYKTYNIGHTDLCLCGEAAETVEHVVQDCQNYRKLRQAVWSKPTDLQTKAWGTAEEMGKTNSFIHQMGVTI
ncbi:retrovirus-related Pol polyprotein from type-1 retrotransposable element R1 2 [Elysia marginata]|uniref:Retrovirus-related Pol polyprotein from type-1 retrotransposable element R1 2 n=1 Tax=Elysia marginata TaxID=1093978 RepID=A0AAV4JD82_9GAST|nr:retrovirus-related Pol polyprotein from type-1 retrotransposable element R1 2 [Elysia marginata]